MVNVSGFEDFDDKWILSMPPNTKVPLSRNDIILDTAELENTFRNNLSLLIQETIDKKRDLIILWRVLRSYMTETKIENNKRIVNEVITLTEQREDLLFIPEFNSVYEAIEKYLILIFIEHLETICMIIFIGENIYWLYLD